MAAGSGGSSLRLTYGKPELVGEGLGDLLFGGEVEAYEDGTDAFAGLLVLGERDLEIVLRDQPRLNETFPDFLAHSVPLSTAQPAILGRFPLSCNSPFST